MTIMENLDATLDVCGWDSLDECGGLQKIRSHRDGRMPVGSQKSRHRGWRRDLANRRRQQTVRHFAG